MDDAFKLFRQRVCNVMNNFKKTIVETNHDDKEHQHEAPEGNNQLPNDLKKRPRLYFQQNGDILKVEYLKK